VAETFAAPTPSRRRLRRAKPKDADDSAEAAVPVTRLTVVVAGEIDGDAEAWLERLRMDEESRNALVDRALAAATRAAAAQRVAVADASVADPTLAGALVVRVGFGEGDELVEGRWERAMELPREARRRTRGEAIRPQERMAAYLGGRDTPLACEELLIRARSDVSGARMREAALQVRVGLEALLAEREAFPQASQADDLGFLDGRRTITGEAANDALKGALTKERAAEVTETLAVCERVLRRRAAHG
jgi:hypothetical protein